MKPSLLLTVAAAFGLTLADMRHLIRDEADVFNATVTDIADSETDLSLDPDNDGTIAAAAANKPCYFTAYTGAHCDVFRTVHHKVKDNGFSKCFDTTNRHSFRLSRGCKKSTTVQLFGGDGLCALPINSKRYDPGCHGVNTGGNWQSANVEQRQ